jgi:cyanophycin synthetase
LRFALSARARDIPVQVSKGILQLGWSCHARKLLSSFTDATSTIATGLARSKIHTNFILSQNAVPVPTCLKVTTPEAALNAAKRLGWPVVIKPASLDQGMGVVPGIRDKDTLIQASDGHPPHSCRGRR